MKVEGLKLGLQQVLNHHGIRRYGANTLWLFAEQVLRMVAGFLVGVWVARYLGPEKFGLLSYALAFVSIFQGIAKLGLDEIVVRDLVQEPEKRDVYLGTSFWLKLLGGVITFLIIVILLFIQSILTSNSSPFTSHFFTETNIYILIIAFGIIFQSFEVIDFYYQATVQAKYISIRRIIQLILSSIIKICLVLIGADLIWFVLVSLFDIISLSIMGWLIYRSQGLPNFVRYFDIGIGKKLLKDSWPLMINSFLTLIILNNANKIYLNNIYGSFSVGIYSSALAITNMWTIITVVVNSSLFPSITSAKLNNKELYKERILNLMRVLLLISFLSSITTYFFADFLILKLYGYKYISAIPVLKILVWSNIFVFLGNTSWQWYINENKQHLAVYRLLFGSIISMTIGYFLIMRFYIYGAVFSTILSYAVSFYIGNIFSISTREIFILQTKALLSFWKIKYILRSINNDKG
jgi:O-antigen/teichoic acid export membrane protein